MSKVDALRALREARHAASPVPAVSRPTAAKAPPAREEAKPKPKPVLEPTSELCGHRSMNGRSCTRPGGHTEKNHRYG